MKKQEWERALYSELYALPDAERRKALAYYDELFLDKFEGGMDEQSILIEFGSPSVAAVQILEDYREEIRRETVPVMPEEPQYPFDSFADEQLYPEDAIETGEVLQRRKFNGFKSVALFFPAMIFLIVVFSVGIALIAVAVSLLAVCAALMLAAPAGVVLSFITMHTTPSVAFVQISICLTMSGLGLMLLPFCYRAAVWLIKMTVKIIKRTCIYTFTSKAPETNSSIKPEKGAAQV